MKALIIITGMLLFTGQSLWAETPDDEADKLYQEAYKLVLDKNYEGAMSKFNKILKDYSSSSWVDDAEFWLCYSREKADQNLEASFDCYYEFVEQNEESKWRDDALQNMAGLARELQKRGKPDFATRLKSLEEEVDDELSLAALQALQNRGDKRAFDTIIKIFNTNKNERIREKMVYMISSFEMKEAREKLYDMAANDKNTEVREQALFWLADAEQTPKVAKFLRERIDKEKDKDVRKKALYSLSELPENISLPELYELAEKHPDDEIRADAVYWISEKSASPAIIDKLVGYAKTDKSDEVREKAIYALSEIESDQALDALVILSKELKNPELRKKALYWLAENGRGDKYINVIYEAVTSDPDKEVRQGAVYALSELESSKSKDYLKKIVESKNSVDIRGYALYWLADRHPGKETTEFLKQIAFNDPSEELQEKAIYSIYEMENNAGVEVLIEIAKKHPALHLRKKAIYWLGESGDERAINALEEILNMPKN